MSVKFFLLLSSSLSSIGKQSILIEAGVLILLLYRWGYSSIETAVMFIRKRVARYLRSKDCTLSDDFLIPSLMEASRRGDLQKVSVNE